MRWENLSEFKSWEALRNETGWGEERGPTSGTAAGEKASLATNRVTSVQAGRQPGYGKRTQLIADGLKDPKLHLEEAIKLERPFSQEWALKPDHVIERTLRMEEPGKECRGGR